MMNKKIFYWARIVLILAGILLLSVIVSLGAGSAGIPFKKIISTLFSHEYTMERSILFDIRMPRIFLAVIVGGALSVAGVIFQGIFQNKLVEPYTLGISGGSALAVSLSVILGLKMLLPVSGFIGAMAAIFIVYFVSRNKSGVMLLTGVMISFISASAVMLIMAVAGTSELHSIIFWLMGSLEEANLEVVRPASALIFVGIAVSVLYSQSLNALNLGEESALHLGINVERTKKILFITGSLITGCCVSISGIIGFVGLVVPHFMRMFVGNDHRILIVASFFTGGIFLLVCDTIARTIILPSELPVGVITGIAGGIVFVYFLLKRRDRCW